MFSAHASEWVGNPVFGIKLALIAAAGGNAWLFHRRGAWRDGKPSHRARIAGALSLSLWLGALACGRLLAYV